MDAVEQLLRRAAGEVASLSGDSLLSLRDKRTDPRGQVDLVTEADLRVDQIVTEGLGRLFPGVPVVSEERPVPEEAGEGDVFVLDPVDGTHNFAAGVPLWAISLARVSGRTPSEGWVLVMPAGLLYHASRTGPSTCEGRDLRVDRGPVEMSLLSVGLSRAVAPLLRAPERWAGVRMMGCYSACLCSVAEGRFSVHAGRGFPWDVAAGWVLVERAGGVIVGFDGGPADPWARKHTLAGAPQAVEAALGILGAG